MSAMGWLVIAIVGFSLAGVVFVISVFMFIKMNIPAVIGDLTGRTVAREIKAMREANAVDRDKRLKSGQVNAEHDKSADKGAQEMLGSEAQKIAHASKRLDKSTDKLEDAQKQKKNNTTALGTYGTEKLSADKGTEALSNSGREIEQNVGTAVLFQTEKLDQEFSKPVTFKVTRSEIVIHSDDSI